MKVHLVVARSIYTDCGTEYEWWAACKGQYGGWNIPDENLTHKHRAVTCKKCRKLIKYEKKGERQ